MHTPVNDPPPEDALLHALRNVARETGGFGASPGVEARLRAEVRKIARAHRIATLKACAAAAVLALAVAVPVWQLAIDEPPVAAGGEVATEFLALRYSNVPLSNGHVVRMEVPEAAMTSFGLQPFGGGARETVLADVLVGEDGLARAVRFVNPSEENVQ